MWNRGLTLNSSWPASLCIRSIRRGPCTTTSRWSPCPARCWSRPVTWARCAYHSRPPDLRICRAGPIAGYPVGARRASTGPAIRQCWRKSTCRSGTGTGAPGACSLPDWAAGFGFTRGSCALVASGTKTRARWTFCFADANKSVFLLLLALAKCVIWGEGHWIPTMVFEKL